MGCLSLAPLGQPTDSKFACDRSPNGVGALDALAAFVVPSAWRAGARLTNSVVQSISSVTASSPPSASRFRAREPSLRAASARLLGGETSPPEFQTLPLPPREHGGSG